MGTGCCVVGQGTFLSQCLSLPMQVHKWVRENLMLGVTLSWTTCSIEGGVDVSKLLHYTAQVAGLAPWARTCMQALPSPFNGIQVTYSHTHFVFNSLKVPQLLKLLPLCYKPFLLASSCGRRLEKLFKMQIKLQMRYSCHCTPTCLLLRAAFQALCTVRGCRVC